MDMTPPTHDMKPWLLKNMYFYVQNTSQIYLKYFTCILRYCRNSTCIIHICNVFKEFYLQNIYSKNLKQKVEYLFSIGILCFVYGNYSSTMHEGETCYSYIPTLMLFALLESKFDVQFSPSYFDRCLGANNSHSYTQLMNLVANCLSNGVLWNK